MFDPGLFGAVSDGDVERGRVDPGAGQGAEGAPESGKRSSRFLGVDSQGWIQGCLKLNSGAVLRDLNTAQREHPLDVVCQRAQTPAN
jgi:hypothetical protein